MRNDNKFEVTRWAAMKMSKYFETLEEQKALDQQITPEERISEGRPFKVWQSSSMHTVWTFST